MTFREKVNTAAAMCGTHIHLSDVIVSEIFGAIGYDFIWVDMEHTMLSVEQVHMHIIAAREAGTPVIVRVPAHDLTVTKRIMEMGPDGIVFPMVVDHKDAQELIDWTVYPPDGKRGCGPKGAVRYGVESEPDYYVNGQRNTCRFVQIELASAAKDAKKIAAIPYLDGIILGMYDLSGSINRLGDVFCDENVALAEKAIKAFKDAGKCVGVSSVNTDPEVLRRYRDMGINMIAVGADYDYLVKCSKESLQSIRAIQAGE